VLTGEGDDVVKIGSALTADTLVSMGDGNDTLELVNSTNGNAAVFKGLENIKTTDLQLLI